MIHVIQPCHLLIIALADRLNRDQQAFSTILLKSNGKNIAEIIVVRCGGSTFILKSLNNSQLR